MDTKIKIATTREGNFEELPSQVTRLLLPNGDEYTFQYDHRLQGLVFNKAYSENEQHITVMPRVSNEILIK